MIQAVTNAASGIVGSVLGGMAQVHGIREAVRLGAATRNDEMSAIQHQIYLQNEAIKQNKKLEKDAKIMQAQVAAEQQKLTREAEEQLASAQRAQQRASEELARQQAELQATIPPPPPAPEGFRMPVWGWAAIGGGSLLLLTAIVAVARRK